MKAVYRSNAIVLFIIAVMVMAVTHLSHASGSGGGGRSLENQYEHGKITFQRKLACDQCPLSGVTLDQQSARDLLPKIRRRGELGKLLSWSERYNVKVYLKKRYQL